MDGSYSGCGCYKGLPKSCPPYEIGGKLNVVRQGGLPLGCYPPVSLREPSPLFHRGDLAVFVPPMQ
jgi:hypothetical protein